MPKIQASAPAASAEQSPVTVAPRRTFNTDAERKLGADLELADCLVQEATDTLQALLTVALDAMQADPLGSMRNVRQLMRHCRALSENLSNDVNCLAERCGVSHIDEREREFSARISAICAQVPA